MNRSREELDAALARLESDLPRLMKDSDEEGDLWAAFIGHTHLNEDGASAAETAYVRCRLDGILSSRGLAPGSAKA
jgi:hypothetical protein